MDIYGILKARAIGNNFGLSHYDALFADAVAGGSWKTASGSIASFPDGTALVPAKSVKVTLEPIQSLNGYDKPWSGGNGKNKLHIDATTTTQNGVTFTVNTDGTVTVNGTATADTVFTLATVHQLLLMVVQVAVVQAHTECFALLLVMTMEAV